MPSIHDLFNARDAREAALSAYTVADRAHRRRRSTMTARALAGAHAAWLDACDYADAVAAALGIAKGER